MEKLKGEIILLLGNAEASCNYPANTYKFRQDSTFLYFFGHSHPNLAAILNAQTGEEILFGDDVDIDDIIWMGPQPSIAQKGEEVGVKKSEPFSKLHSYINEYKNKGKKIHFLPPYRNYNKILLNSLLSSR
jgi:Aminopeptidase P, N-terminal domain.